MLSDVEIKRRAQEKIKTMDPAVRQKMEQEINEGLDLVNKVIREGDRSLTKEEWTKFSKFEIKNMSSQGGGGFEAQEIEKEIMGQLNLSREEIANMKKNPYKASMLKRIIVAILSGLGIVATYGISKATGVDLSAAYIGLSGLSSMFAIGFGNQLVKAAKFKRLQQSYEKQDFQEQEIDAAVYREIKEEVKRRRGM